ncbi:MAG TPA: response regulator [Candidatus Competibacter sp.]|jgi:twitching motility two-component system response regulator PilH|nr:response regulator [Candidatus Competibacter sp.]HRX60454.1 response regulator [Candidatus Competibacter sp.]
MAINKILVVDDSPADLKNINDILSEAGFFVVTAANGKEAIEKAKAEKPSVIFMDIIMPTMDGFATCRALSNDEGTKGIPVIFVTSKSQKADRLWAQMQGAKGYITKPYSADEIIDQLKAFR